MNKKFSTLLAGILLAASVGISAQTAPFPGVTSITSGSWSVGEEVKSGQYYILTDASNNYLTIQEPTSSDAGYKLQMVDVNTVSSSLAAIDNALWKVTIQTTGQGSSTSFTFTNKATGYVITFDPKNAVKTDGNNLVPAITVASRVLDGSYPTWRWYPQAYNNQDDTNFINHEALTAVFGTAADSTMALAVTGNQVYAYKYSNKKGRPTAFTSGDALELRINKAGSYVLKAQDLNRYELTNSDGDKINYMQINFNSEIADNLFADQYQAQNFVTSSTTASYSYEVVSTDGLTSYGGNSSEPSYTSSLGYVALNKIVDNDLSFKYAYVDTAYYASTGGTYKTYNKIGVTKDKAKLDEDYDNVITKVAEGLPVDAFLFRFTKNLATDEIWIESKTQMVERDDRSASTYNDSRSGATTRWYSATDYADYIYTGTGVSLPSTATEVMNAHLNNRILSHCTLAEETSKVVTFYRLDRANANKVNLLATDTRTANLTSIDEGVYIIKVRNNRLKNGYAIAKMDGETAIVSNESKIDPAHMAAYQWVVEKVSRTGELSQISPVKVINREYAADKTSNSELFEAPKVKGFLTHQFYKDAELKDGELVYNGDTLTFEKIDAAPARQYSYVNLSEEDLVNKVYNFKYLSALAENKMINVGAQSDALGKDTILTIGDEGARFTLEIVKRTVNNKTVNTTQSYGYNGVVSEGKGLVKTAYYLRVNDANKLGNNNKYVYTSYVDGTPKYILSSDATRRTPFYLKEQNCVDGTHYYALVDTTTAYDGTLLIDLPDRYSKAGVDDTYAQLRREKVGETRTSAFALIPDETLIYRELNGADTKVVGDVEPFTAPTVVNFYRSRIADKQYLFEDRLDDSFSKGKHINFLGVRYQGGAHNDSTAMYVDTADIRNPFIPQYMVAVGVTVEKEGKYCPIHGMNAGCAEEHLENVPAHVWGRYLINAQDSVNVELKNNAVSRYQWENKYTRLAFVHAMHVGDTLLVFKRGEFPRTSDGVLDYMKAVKWAGMYKDAKLVADSVEVIDVKDRNFDATKNKTKIQDDGNYKFAFRLVNDDDARDFIIESHDGNRDNETYSGTNKSTYKAVKVENGVPVIISYASSSEGVINADWWNIDDRQSVATGNDEVKTTEVKVIAAEGKVTILNATGKKVVISNVLGQTVANTVVTTDNASIAAPKGVVVVAVEGEDAVKTIVK